MCNISEILTDFFFKHCRLSSASSPRKHKTNPPTAIKGDVTQQKVGAVDSSSLSVQKPKTSGKRDLTHIFEEEEEGDEE